jgi:uncharacterized DUF497 family protein
MRQPLFFDWNTANEAVHVAKHGVAFLDGIEVFLDPRRLDRIDDRYDYREERRQAVGKVDGICFHVTYTMRGDTAWIISVRRASRKERHDYQSSDLD